MQKISVEKPRHANFSLLIYFKGIASLLTGVTVLHFNVTLVYYEGPRHGQAHICKTVRWRPALESLSTKDESMK